MKHKLFLISLIAILLPLSVIAQGFTLSSASISWGKGALTSGLDVVFTFTNQDSTQFFIANGNNERSNMNYGWNVTENFAPAISFGMFRNVAWVGLRGTYSPFSFMDIFHWSGVGFSKDKTLNDPGTNPNRFFSFNAVYLHYKNFCIGYGLSHWKQDVPNHLINLKYTWSLNSNTKSSAEVTYNCREDIPMFVMCLSRKL